MSKFTSVKVINSRWRNNDFVGAAGSTHTFPDALHDEFLVDWEFQIANGSIVITETPTTGNIQMATLTVGNIVLTGTATGFPASPTIIGTSPIGVVTASGTSTISLNANYQTTGTYVTTVSGTSPITASGTTSITVGIDQAALSVAGIAASVHTHPYQNAGTYITAVSGTSPINASTNTAGEAAISVSTGTTSATVSLGSHLHTGTYQDAGTYVTAVNGTAPIAASTTTAGVVSVSLGANFASSVHTHATSSITSGNFVATLAAGTGVTVTGADANAAAKTVAIGQAVAATDTVTFASVNKLAITAPATSATFAVANAKTFTVSNTITLAGTDAVTANVGNGGSLSPAGAVTAYLGSNANIPTGWLLCDGAIVSRATFATLFGVISTTFGVGDGSTTFGLPDLTGNILVGASVTAAAQAGTTDSFLNASYVHTHSHNHVTNPAATTSGINSASIGMTSGVTAVATNGHTHSTDIAATTSDTDASNSSGVTIKRTRVNYIIKS